MTCRELLQIEHPDKINTDIDGDWNGCPHHYGYADAPNQEFDQYGNVNCVISCKKCWDREVDPKATGMNKNVIDALCEVGHPNVVTSKELKDIQQKVYSEFGVPESVLNTDENKKLCEKHREMMTPEEPPHILDSGDRTEFESGAVRDMRVGKGRCDLLPLDVTARYIELYINQSAAAPIRPIINFQKSGDSRDLYDSVYMFTMRVNGWDCNHSTMLLEVAKHFEEGAKKYGDDNWKKGIPTNVYIDSAVRHYLKFLRGDKDEPHDRAFCWNILCCIWTCIHKPKLNVYRNLEKGE